MERLRQLGVEPTDVEVKSAGGGLLSTVSETTSAFANGTGGTLLLGIDEASGLQSAKGFDARSIRDALADACANKVDPPCRAPIEIEEFEGARVVQLDVPGLDPVEKPCFVGTRGTYGGSFIRGGDGDRRLTHYEVTHLLSNRTQPVFDRELVSTATAADLDGALVAAYLTRIRRRSQAFRESEDDRLMVRLGVLAADGDGVLLPTAAGLRCFGEYPQESFPQLFVPFVVLPRLHMVETGPDGRRFLDNATITGPIPTIVADVVAFAIRDMRVGAIIVGIGREDSYDYPLDVIRELIVNALMHHDYSPDAQGAQLQVELYPDRLVVRSPGGLYGPIIVSALGSEGRPSTSRNRALAAMIAEVEDFVERGRPLCENHGSGLLAVMAELRRAGMSPPEFDAPSSHVTVTVPQHALLAPGTVEWIGTLRQAGLTGAQHLALAMIRSTGRVTDSMLQGWGVDRLAAGAALKYLVQRGIAVDSGSWRYASYRLVPSAPAPNRPVTSPTGVDAELDAVVQVIRADGTTAAAVTERLGLPRWTVARRLGTLVERGLITRTSPVHSSRQSYRLVDQEDS